MDMILFEVFLKSIDLIPQPTDYYNGTIYVIDNVIVLSGSCGIKWIFFKNTSKWIMSICAFGRGFTVCFFGGNETGGNSFERFLTPYQYSRLPINQDSSSQWQIKYPLLCFFRQVTARILRGVVRGSPTQSRSSVQENPTPPMAPLLVIPYALMLSGLEQTTGNDHIDGKKGQLTFMCIFF